MLLRGWALFWGTPLLQFVPWHRYAIELLRGGHLPLWNPLLGAGAPLLANYQSALLYPPNLLLLLTGPEYGHGLLVFLHLIWAGLGMRALARRLGMQPAGQMISALAFSLSGYMVSRAGFISINHTAAWLPWLVMALDSFLDRVRTGGKPGAWIRPLCLFCLALAMQWLAGHAQTSWYTLLLLAVWAVWRLGAWHDRPRQFRAIGLLVGAGALTFAMAAAQLLPTLEYLQQTPRATALDMEYALTYSFWPWRILGLFLPDLFGSPVRGDFWGYGNYWEDAIYMGILPALLAVGCVWKKLRENDASGRMVRFLLIVGGISLVLSLGKNTPIFPFLFRHIPSFSLFQAPARWNLILIFSLSLLAGFGLDTWSTPTGRGLYWTRLGTAGAAVIGLAAFLGSLWMGDIEPSFVRAFAIAGLWLAAAGLLTLFLPKSFTPRFQAVLGALLLLDLVWAGWGLNPALPLSVYQGETPLQELSSGADGARLYMPSDVEYTATFERSHRFDTFDPGIDWRMVRDAGIPNAPSLESIPSLNNFDPFVPNRYEQLIRMIETNPSQPDPALLALADVGWVAADLGVGPLGVQYSPVTGAARLWLVPHAVMAGSLEQSLQMLSSGEVDLQQTVIIEAPIETIEHSGGPSQGEILASGNPNEVRLWIEAPEGTWLALADTWYPGWRLYIDEDRADMYPAFAAFRGAWVPAGNHEIRMCYRPMSFYIGVAVSVIGWLFFAFLYFRWNHD